MTHPRRIRRTAALLASALAVSCGTSENTTVREPSTGDSLDASLPPDGGRHSADDASATPFLDGGTAARDAGQAPVDGAASGEPDAALSDGGQGPSRPTFTLRVLSFNGWSAGAESVAADIASTGAHVVGMQEVTPSEAQDICAALGEGWAFVQEDRANTFAILTKLPILTRIGVTEHTRGGVAATLELAKGVRFHLFDTHLNWTPYGPYQLAVDGMTVEGVVASENAVRMDALLELLAMAEPQVASDDATFLVGDFNAPSHLDYEPAVPWPTSVVAHQKGFVDSYRELHPENPKKWAGEFAIDDPGITWTQLASSEPHGCYDRIDFVYYSKGDTRPVDSREAGLSSSDHRAVLSTFELSEPLRTTRPRNPLPLHAGTGVARHPLLTWTPALGATSQVLYLGKASSPMVEVEVTDSKHIPALLAPNQTYHWRIDTQTESGTLASDTWSFTTRTGAGFQPDKLRYAPGQTITITFDGADAARDWIALHARTTAYGSGSPGVDWKYLNDSTSAPSSVVTAGSITLTAPVAAGTYVLRFFHDDGYSVEDELAIRVE